jgi:MFS family permease
MTNGPLAAARLLLPMVALALSTSALVIGLLSSLFTLVPMVLNVRFGRWVDSIGSRTPFIVSHMLIVAGGAAFAAVPTIGALAVSAVLIGAGCVFGHLATTRGVSEADLPDRRMRNLGYMVLLYSVAQFLAPMAMGLIFDGYGGRVAMASFGLVGVVALLVIASGWHAFRDVRDRSRADAPRLADLLRHGDLARRVVVSGMFSSVQTIFPFVISIHAFAIGLTTVQAGLIVGAFALGTIASRAGVGWLVRRADPRQLLSAALIAGAAGYAALSAVTDLQPLMLLAFALGLPIGLGVPVSLGLIYETAPEHRANEAVGLTMTVTNVFQTALPMLAGLAASGLGAPGMTLLLAASMSATAWLGWRVNAGG